MHTSPIGIDLGLNIHSSYEQLFNNNDFQVEFFEKKPPAIFPNIPASTSLGQELGEKLIDEHNNEISNLSLTEKEQLLITLGKRLGIVIEVKSILQPSLKA